MKIDYIFAHNTIGCFYFLLYCFKISYSIAPISSFSNRLYNSNKIIIQMQIKIFNTFCVCLCENKYYKTKRKKLKNDLFFSYNNGADDNRPTRSKSISTTTIITISQV